MLLMMPNVLIILKNYSQVFENFCLGIIVLTATICTHKVFWGYENGVLEFVVAPLDLFNYF